VRLCPQVQDARAATRADTSIGTILELGTSPSSNAGAAMIDSSTGGGSTDIKVDGTPVMTSNFAIQGYVSHALQQSDFFPNDRFMGEEDATDVRRDQSLQTSALSMAHRLNPNLSLGELLTALDRGVEERNTRTNTHRNKFGFVPVRALCASNQTTVFPSIISI
jgi:3'-phosphoadenosine 5'-phosphosulfate (PAPS) 3'-phosphatase